MDVSVLQCNISRARPNLISLHLHVCTPPLAGRLTRVFLAVRSVGVFSTFLYAILCLTTILTVDHFFSFPQTDFVFLLHIFVTQAL